MYKVKQLAELAGISVRTLHYYDEIGLLKPTEIRSNGYRYYADDAVYRLQQILFYREIGLELIQIKTILDQPGFDTVSALRSHKKDLQQKITRLQNLVDTVDDTIKHIAGEKPMSKKRLFKAFSQVSQEQQEEYKREARLQYDPKMVNESYKRWNDYSKDEQQAIIDEGNAIYDELADMVEAQKSPSDPDVQAILERWHQHLQYFYEPTLEILEGLGQLYNSSPDFIANFEKIHPALPQFLQDSIAYYVDELETAALEVMLEDDEKNAKTARS